MENQIKKQWNKPEIKTELKIKQTLGGPLAGGSDSASKRPAAGS